MPLHYCLQVSLTALISFLINAHLVIVEPSPNKDFLSNVLVYSLVVQVFQTPISLS